jgi:hypothetical protein
LNVFPEIELFERVVVENGALLYRPASHEHQLLSDPPPAALVDLLHQRQVRPVSVGHGIVSTWEPHQTTVLEVIQTLGIEWQVIFNKGAVMILPSGVNKAFGLQVALAELGLSAHNVVGVGDAENDHAFLNMCECAVAVANALPALKERADLVTQADHVAGVTELIDRMITSDLQELEPQLKRHELLLGTDEAGQDVRLRAYGGNVLLAGTSGSGKSTLTTAFLERLAEQGYQYCLIDPEGDYQNFAKAANLGSSKQVPEVDEILNLLQKPEENVIINLLGATFAERPPFFQGLMPALLELRARTGRPHWIIIDESHHLLPSSWHPDDLILPQDGGGLYFITVHPDQVSKAVLATVDTCLVIGETPQETIDLFCQAVGENPPPVPAIELKPGEAILWQRQPATAPVWFRSIPPEHHRRRHLRKYAEGEMTEDRVFYFRGPEDKLNLRAQNLMFFIQIAEGVDDETWLYHLHRGDYSHWFREAIHDDSLAQETELIEGKGNLSAQESRTLIRKEIEKRYTGPA